MKNSKIRFWCKEMKIMYYWFRDFSEISLSDDAIKPVLNKTVEGYQLWKKMNYVSTEFIGVSDMYNANIYEGDILECRGVQSVVEYRNCSYVLLNAQGNSIPIYSLLDREHDPTLLSHYRIVGNIFQGVDSYYKKII